MGIGYHDNSWVGNACSIIFWAVSCFLSRCKAILIAGTFLNSYGDRSPKSLLGRVFCIVWIITGLVIISIFIAMVTASLAATTHPHFPIHGSLVSKDLICFFFFLLTSTTSSLGRVSLLIWVCATAAEEVIIFQNYPDMADASAGANLFKRNYPESVPHRTACDIVFGDNNPKSGQYVASLYNIHTSSGKPVMRILQIIR